MTTDDAEYLLPNPIRRWDLFELLTGWNTNWQYNKELVQLSCGYVNHYIQTVSPGERTHKSLSQRPDFPDVFCGDCRHLNLFTVVATRCFALVATLDRRADARRFARDTTWRLGDQCA